MIKFNLISHTLGLFGTNEVEPQLRSQATRATAEALEPQFNMANQGLSLSLKFENKVISTDYAWSLQIF